jgi:hypothetical protein
MSITRKPSPEQLRLVKLHHEAAAAVDALFLVAKHCADKEVRAESLQWLARVGTRAGLRLHSLAKHTDRGDEVRQAATQAAFWPAVISSHKVDQHSFNAALPPHLVGTAKPFRLGRASLETVHIRWALSFVQCMDFGRWGWQKTQCPNEANEYLLEHHGIQLAHEDIQLAGSLPVISRKSLKQWKEALKKHLHHHFPDHGLAEHPDWKKEGRKKSRDGIGNMSDDPKEFHSWIIGRVGMGLAQLATPKRATR